MDSVIKSGNVIRVGDENILHTTVPQAVEHGRPELGALIFAYPHAQYILRPSSLSPLIDCFDGLVMNWTVGRSPNAALVNTMLDQAIAALPEGQHPIIHTDRGCHYRWPGWIERMERTGLTRSMSPKGCSPDNSACEGFLGRLKNEMFYGRSWYGYFSG